MRKAFIVGAVFVALSGLAAAAQAQQTPVQKPKMPQVAALKKATPGVTQCIQGRLATGKCEDGNCTCNAGEWFAGGGCATFNCFWLCNSLADCAAPAQN